MEKNAKRRTKIVSSSVYFDIVASIGNDRKSIVELSKLLKKSSPAVFGQVKKLSNEGYLKLSKLKLYECSDCKNIIESFNNFKCSCGNKNKFKNLGESKLSGDEKRYSLDLLKLNVDIYEYFLKKDESIKKNKKILMEDFISAIDMLSLSSFLVGKNYTLEKLFEKYFSSKFDKNMDRSADLLKDLRKIHWHKIYETYSKILDKDNDWKIAIDNYKNMNEPDKEGIKWLVEQLTYKIQK